MDQINIEYADIDMVHISFRERIYHKPYRNINANKPDRFREDADTEKSK